MTDLYVHGYDDNEAQRLQDQAETLSNLLHRDTRYSPGVRVLEAGCGIGAQTMALLRNSPGILLTSIDISTRSLEQARQKIEAVGLQADFQVADILDLQFDAAFDHIFVCHVLEHLTEPVAALKALRRVLKPGGTITAIEGDHGSTCFWPESAHARKAIACQVELQRRAGGDAMLGRRLYPLLKEAGYSNPIVSPRIVYADGSRPELMDGFTRKTFTAMIQGVREQALRANLATESEFDLGIADLHRAAAEGGVFYYSFFKAVACA